MIGAAYSWLTSCNRHSRKRLATPISVWHSTSKNKSRFSSYGTITKFIQFSWVWNICCGFIAFWYEFDFIWYPYHLLITHITVAKKQRKAKLNPKIKLNHMHVPNFVLAGKPIWNIKPLSVIKCWIYNWYLPCLIYRSHSTCRPKVQLAVVHQWITKATQFPTIPPPPANKPQLPSPSLLDIRQSLRKNLPLSEKSVVFTCF